MMKNFSLIFLFAAASASGGNLPEPADHCGETKPSCLQYALRPPEYAFLLASRMSYSPEFKRDLEAFAAGGDKEALVRAWRKRIKQAAARSLQPAKGKPAGTPNSYLSGRLAVAKAKGLISGASAELRRLDSRPERAAESREFKERVRAVMDHIASLSLDDVTALAAATDESQQTDYLGKWIAACLRPAGGIEKVVRSKLPECRRALGGYPPMEKAAR